MMKQLVQPTYEKQEVKAADLPVTDKLYVIRKRNRKSYFKKWQEIYINIYEER